MVHSFLALVLVAAVANAVTTEVRVDLGFQDRVFDGIGGLSGGTGPRLLIDYPEPFRSDILDYLFKPNYGASLHILKLEIGGTGQSSDGTESSHMPTESVTDYTSGYEWWMMKEALKRNPKIILYGLPWTFPGHLQTPAGDEFSLRTVDYLVSWVVGAKKVYNASISYLGFHNESPWRPDLIVALRAALDRAGGPGPDYQSPDIIEILKRDQNLFNAISHVGFHYPVSILPIADNTTFWNGMKTCGKPIWSSEEFSTNNDDVGGRCWAKLLNRNYVEGLLTSSIAWDILDAWYDVLSYSGDGLLWTREPWSSHYSAQPGMWSTAHTTQFAHPGWFYLRSPASLLLNGGGSVVSLVSPPSARRELTIVIETMDGRDSVCSYERRDKPTPPVPAAQDLHICLADPLCTTARQEGLHVWLSNFATNTFFEKQADVKPGADCCFTFTAARNAHYTLSTTTGQSKGKPAVSPPPSKRFPLPFETRFDEPDRFSDFPKLLSDQAGVYRLNAGVLEQQVLVPPVGSYGPMTRAPHRDPEPCSILGDRAWADYTVSATFRLPDRGFNGSQAVARVLGRLGHNWSVVNQYGRPIWGYALEITAFGAWSVNVSSNAGSKSLASGNVATQPGQWHTLAMSLRGSVITPFLDGRVLTTVRDSTWADGLAGLGCGWHACAFNQFSVVGF